MRRSTQITLRLLATLTLILSGVLGTGATIGAASTAQEEAAGGLWSMGIGARTTDAQGNVDHTVGAHFTVTSEDGEFVGECTLPEPPQPGVAWWNCRVDVPSDRISLIWEDLDSIPAGYAPVENPIVFDPTTYETGPHNIGAIFDNVPSSEPLAGSSTTSASATSETKDISLIIRDPNDASIVVNGTCFSLLESSTEACDDDYEGQVHFNAVSPGTYTVRQTRTPEGYTTANDFPITIEGRYPNVPVGYLVNQTADQTAPGTRNLSVVFVDSETLTKIDPSPICVTVVGVSEEGCDLVLVDGQVGFLGVQTGTFSLSFSQVPAGWSIVDGETVAIADGIGPQIHFVLVDNGVKNGSTNGASSTSGSSSSSDTSSTAGSSGTDTGTRSNSSGTMPLTIRAQTCADGEAPSYGGCEDAIGARFTVTTENGKAIGECALLESVGDDPASCSVPVPLGLVVIVTEDVSSIAPGFAPQSNPIRFDTGVAADPDCGYCHWGPTFVNGVPSERIGEIEDMVVWAGEHDTGAAITVETEDGELVGDCVLEGPVTGRTYCRIPVQIGPVLIVTEDVSTLAPGLAPESNPIRFDTSVAPFTQCAPCHWGPEFRNGPITTSTSTTDPGSASSAGSSDTGKTWTASVQVMLCDGASCSAGAGVTVNIYLDSGEWMGSCTTGEPQPTPWGVEISTCSVEGMPFNADFVATQDPSTIPAGYVPRQDQLTLHVADLYPGGGDQATFTFQNIHTSDSSGSSGASSSASGSGEYTIVMTFRACPEGFEPDIGDFWAECTIPLDAPDASYITWGVGRGGGASITTLGRRDDGAYIYTGSSAAGVTLSFLEPVLRDSYQVFGTDLDMGVDHVVRPAPGETREITVFYYYEP